MKLLCEMSETISINRDQDQNYYIEGIFAQADIVNGNGRQYPEEVMDREVKLYNENYISKNRAVGELDHPPTPNVAYKHASHKIIKLDKKGTDYHGKALILNTTEGKQVQALLDGGVTLAVSTRGTGSVKLQGNIQIVQPDFKLSTIDIVSDPSAPSAMVNGLLENKDWVYQSGIWVARDIEQMQKQLHRKKLDEAKILKGLKKFLSSL